MRAALLCDVDQTVYHVGDEAIADASAAMLRERGHEVVMLSRHEKYGPGGEPPALSIPALTFPWSVTERVRYLEEIRAVLQGDTGALPAHDKLFGIIDALRTVDALVIGGGGSLNSRYGWLLSERVATALVAAHLGKPVVLTGQSLGPELSAADAALVGEMLDVCLLAGLRDPDSLALARSIRPDHPRLHACADDATALDLAGLSGQPGASADEEAEADAEAGPVISVTIGSDPSPLPSEAYAPLLAEVIDAVAERTGGRVEFVPHMADPDAGGGDERVHAEVAALLQHPSSQAPLELAAEAALRTARADYVITTRFHPVVFGASSGASVLALPLNRYGISRMRGALSNAGWSDAVVPLAALWRPGSGTQETEDASSESSIDRSLLALVVDELVGSRESEKHHLGRSASVLEARARSWWDAVTAALGGRLADCDAAVESAQERARALTRMPRFSPDLRRSLAQWTRDAGGQEAAPHAAPTFSVITRTKDRALMLDRAVQDLLAQSRADWEMIIVNDGGEPAAVDAVVDRWAHEAAGRIRVLHSVSSSGMEAASNRGLAEARAALVSVHDDDDTWSATFLQETAAHLAAHPEQLAVTVRTEIIHEHLEGEHFVEDSRELNQPQLRSIQLSDFMALNRMAPISLLYCRAVHERLGGYDESLPVVGDWAFHLLLLQETNVGLLDRPLAQWRLRPAQDGPGGNSMFMKRAEHRHFDGVLRERYFQEWVSRNGIGLPLHLAREQRDLEERLGARIAGLEERIAQLTAALENREGPPRASTADTLAALPARTRSLAGRAARKVWRAARRD